MTEVTPLAAELADSDLQRADFVDFARRNPTAILGSLLLLTIVLIAIFAPLIAPGDPQALDPIKRLRPPSANFGSAPTCTGATCSHAPSTAHGSRSSSVSWSPLSASVSG